jgi:hypothetical protein
MEKKSRNTEEMNDGWTTNLAFLVDVTGHMNNLNKSYKVQTSSLPTGITTSKPSKSGFNCEKTS